MLTIIVEIVVEEGGSKVAFTKHRPPKFLWLLTFNSLLKGDGAPAVRGVKRIKGKVCQHRWLRVGRCDCGARAKGSRSQEGSWCSLLEGA